MIIDTMRACSVCESGELREVVNLPKFPFTGIYVHSPDMPRYRGVDQALMLCGECGHGQLRNVVDPRLVYDRSYTHRSSTSPISTTGNDFFAQFLTRVAAGRTFRRVLEIGCNDLYLLKKIESLGERLFGVDPIWKGREHGDSGKITVLGNFVEELNCVDDLGGPPDLIISAHTFEHIQKPKNQLERLVNAADANALFVVEVPGFDSLLMNCRFDQVFHQHIHYFSLASFERMIYEIGGEYIAHTFNYGYWGGTILVAFRKQSDTRPPSFQNRFSPPKENQIHRQFAMFLEQLDACMHIIASWENETIYGYGAAQMLPTIAYHMKSDLAFVKSVLDDNPDRDGLMYPYLPVVIQKPEAEFSLEGANVLITALDSIRPILKRVIAMKAKRILVPLHAF